MPRTITDEQRYDIAQAIFDRVEGNSGDFGVANEDELEEYLEKADDLLAALPQLHFVEEEDAKLVAEACADYSERVEHYVENFSPREVEVDGGETQQVANRLKELAKVFEV